METICRSDVYEPSSEAAGKPGLREIASGAALQSVKTSEILFHAGDDRVLYRVERGAVCHYMLWADGRYEVIEFAFPGDIVGLGHMSRHVSTAQAMVDTVVSRVGDDDFEDAIEHDDRLSFRLAAAAEREFDYLRDQAVASNVSANELPAAAKLANFLLVLSSLNGPEGRDRNFIGDDITAGFVAERLNLSIEKLGAALLSLKKQGAVRETPGGLRIVDATTLQRMAEAA